MFQSLIARGTYNLVYIITYYCCTIGFPELAGTIAVFSKEGGAGLVDTSPFPPIRGRRALSVLGGRLHSLSFIGTGTV